jgi:hypothetical protein
MAKGIRINFLSDVKDFLRGTKDVEKELDEVADSLDDVAKDGDKATEKLEKSFKDMAKEASKAGKDAQDGLGKGFKGAAAHGGEAAQEIKDEFKSNLSEVTSSFDGSVESMGDLVQGTLGGLVGSLGPLGIAVGAAGALGVGVLIAKITEAAEEAESAKQRMRDLGIAMIESGASTAQLEFVNEQLKLIVSNSDDAVKTFEEITKVSDETGLSAEQLALAYSGQEDALKDMAEASREALEAEASYQNLTNEGSVALDGKAEALEDVTLELEAMQESQARAAEIEADWLASGGAESLAKAEAIATIDAAYDEAVNSVGDFINAETGIFDITAYAASIEERKRLLVDYQTSLATSGLTTEQKNALNAMGVDQASALLAGLQDPGVDAATKKTITDSLTEAAKTSSGQAKGVLEEAFKEPTEAEVKAELNAKAAQRDLNQFITNAERTPIKIRAQIVDREGRVVG